MKISIAILTLAALAASPAAAQLHAGGHADVQVGADVQAGGLLGGVTGALGQTVTAVEGTVNGIAEAGLRLATRADLRAGATVRDRRGERIGTIAEVRGDSALVVRGGRAVHVPLASLYGSADGLVCSLSRAEVHAAAAARADAGLRY